MDWILAKWYNLNNIISFPLTFTYLNLFNCWMKSYVNEDPTELKSVFIKVTNYSKLISSRLSYGDIDSAIMFIGIYSSVAFSWKKLGFYCIGYWVSRVDYNGDPFTIFPVYRYLLRLSLNGLISWEVVIDSYPTSSSNNGFRKHFFIGLLFTH